MQINRASRVPYSIRPVYLVRYTAVPQQICASYVVAKKEETKTMDSNLRDKIVKAEKRVGQRQRLMWLTSGVSEK